MPDHSKKGQEGNFFLLRNCISERKCFNVGGASGWIANDSGILSPRVKSSYTFRAQHVPPCNNCVLRLWATLICWQSYWLLLTLLHVVPLHLTTGKWLVHCMWYWNNFSILHLHMKFIFLDVVESHATWPDNDYSRARLIQNHNSPCHIFPLNHLVIVLNMIPFSSNLNSSILMSRENILKNSAILSWLWVETWLGPV